MAELKRTLLKGVMNIDLDARLLEPGSYRYAENVSISQSDTTDVGALENIRGNQQVAGLTVPNTYVTVGSVRDDLSNKIYWFFLGGGTEGIYELDLSINFDVDEFITNPLNPQLPDIPNPLYGQPRNQVNRILEFSRTRRIFNFNTSNLITGVNIIGDLLYWTDGLNPPRKINIERFRNSGNFYTLTPGLQSGPTVSGSEITPSDTVGAVFHTDVNPQYTEPITGRPAEALVGFNTAGSQPAFPGDLISVAKRPPLFPPVIVTPGATSEIDNEDNPSEFANSGDFLYNNFVYFAYRYRYRDGETTPLSPFSRAAFIPRNYSLQRNPSAIQSMVNRFRQVEIKYDVGDSEVTEVELIVTSSRDVSLKSLVTINKAENNIVNSTSDRRQYETFVYDNNKVYSTLPSDQITRIYDDVPIRALAQEIAGNRLVYGNYIQNYNLKVNNEDGANLIPDFRVGFESTVPTAGLDAPSCSVKSDRDYQVGIVYLDQEGRQTPVLLSNEAVDTNGDVISTSSIRLPFNRHNNSNSLTIDIASAAPYWATHYRFFIKQTQGTFYNVYPKAVARDKDSSSSRIFMRLDGSEVNKIQPDTVFSLKGANGEPEIIKRLFRVDPFIQQSSGENTFSLQSDGMGGFTFNQDVENLVQFNVPFEVAQENTQEAFVKLQRATNGHRFPITATASTVNFTISNGGTSLPNLELVSVVRLRPNSADVTYPTTAYSISSSQRLTLNAPTGQELASNDTLVVTYTYDAVPENAPEAHDYYVAVVPVIESDLAASNLPETIGVVDERTLWETVPQVDNVTDIYFEHGTTFRCINGAHTDSKVEVIGGNSRVQQLQRSNDIAMNGSIPATQLDDIPVEASNVGTPVSGPDGRVQVTLPYFNCYSYPNGIEETKILGNFNEQELRPGIKASTVNEAYRQRNQRSYLIHSGIFDDDTNLNRLNEFSVGRANTIELDIAEGSVQKIHSRNTNLMVFQEDKVKNVPINKNLIQTAGGNSSLSTDSQFFGTESAYAGEYGISTNPESFATYGNRVYWADRNRGALMRWANNGITEISKNGVEIYTRNRLATADLIIGSYDDFHDQMHFTIRDRIPQPGSTPNLLQILMATEGRPDPRSECNRNEEIINFQRFYAFIVSEADGLQLGDVIFIDRNTTTFFNGEYRWYRLQDGASVAPDSYNRVIQVSPYGVITGIEEDCATNRPPDLNRDSFDISVEGFADEFEACANGIIDGQAYFEAASPSQQEPINGSIIYEDRHAIVPSSRTGWYLITVEQAKWTIRITNGVVDRRVRCGAISAGRRAILGSNPIAIVAGTQAAERNIILCNAPYAEQLLFHTGDSELPQVGDTIYDNNHDATLATVSTFYTFVGGAFVQVDANAVVTLAGVCSELRCFNSPSDLFSQSTSDPFTFTFEGIQATYDISTDGTTTTTLDTRQEIQNATIEYVVQGARRYPAQGNFIVNARMTNGQMYYNVAISDDNTEDINEVSMWQPITIGSVDSEGDFVNDTFSLPQPNNAVNLSEGIYPDFIDEEAGAVTVHITSVCYRGISFQGNSQAFVGNAVTSNQGEACGNTVNDAVYYDAEATPRQYFNDSDLTVAWSRGAGQFPVSNVFLEAGGGVVTQVSTISANGTETSFFRCIENDDTYEVTLGYTGSNLDSAKQAACNAASSSNTALTVTYFADQPLDNFGDNLPTATTSPGNPPTVLRTDNGLNPPDGFYTDGTVIRELTSGAFSAPVNNESCSFSITATLNASSTITGGTATILLSPVTGQDIVTVGETYTVTATARPPSGFEISNPRYSVGGGALQVGSSYTFTGVGTAAQLDGTDPAPSETVVFSGSLTATTLRRATITWTNSVTGNGATVNGSSASSGSVTTTGQPGDDYNIAATIAASGVNSAFSSGPFQDGSSLGFTRRLQGTFGAVDVNDSVVWTGNTVTVQPSTTYSHRALIAQPIPTGATSGVDSQAISSGSTRALVATIGVQAGFEIASISPANGQTHTFNFGDQPTIFDTTYTVTTRRVSFTAQNECGGSDETFFANTSTFATATILYASGDSSSSTRRGAVVISDGTDFRTWNGSSFTGGTQVCTVAPPADHNSLSLRSGSSESAACTNAGGTVYVNDGATSLSNISTVFANAAGTDTTLAGSGYYSDGTNWRFWSGSSFTSSGLCSSISFSAGSNPSITITGTGVNAGQSGTVTITGGTASFRFAITGGLAGQTGSASARLIFNGVTRNLSANSNAGDSESFSIGAGTYSFTIDQISYTNWGGAVQLTATF